MMRPTDLKRLSRGKASWSSEQVATPELAPLIWICLTCSKRDLKGCQEVGRGGISDGAINSTVAGRSGRFSAIPTGAASHRRGAGLSPGRAAQERLENRRATSTHSTDKGEMADTPKNSPQTALPREPARAALPNWHGTP